MQRTQSELGDHDIPEGLVPSKEIEVPEDFTREEWEDLTEVIISVFYYSNR